MTATEIVTLASGRRIAVHQLAAGDGTRTVVFCHPAPGAGNLDPAPDETARRRVTLIGVDRPGYGRSDPVTGSTWAGVDVAADDIAKCCAVGKREACWPRGTRRWSTG